MKNKLISVANIRGYVSGEMVMLNAEDVARGWGFTQIKNGTEYVRWDRVNDYLKEFGFSPQVGKDDYIPENIVYRLGFKASNETAQKFQALLADNVLPNIRKFGAYMTEETLDRALTDPDFLIQLATQLKAEKTARKRAEAQIEADRPKVTFADAVCSSKQSILIGELAKLIKQNGIDVGQNRLFKWLREHKYLMRNNEPTQKAMELKLFDVTERTINNPDGSVRITRTTKVTGKGQVYFINKFKNQA